MNDLIRITDSAFFDPLRDAGAASGLEGLRLGSCEPDGRGVGAVCRPASGSESRNARFKELAREKMDWTDVDMDLCAINHEQLAQRVQDEVRRMHGLLLWALYHHQGASSPVGQPIRRALGIGEHDHMTPEQIELAKAMGMLNGT